MPQTFNLGNALQAGDAVKANAQNREFNSLKMSGERQRQDLTQREFNADQQQKNTEKLLRGFEIMRDNPGITPQVLDELGRTGIINTETIPDMLAEAQSNPESFAQKIRNAESQIRLSIGQPRDKPTFGAPVAGVNEQGDASFRRFAPTGESTEVEGFAPSVGTSTSAQGRFFGSLTEGLSPEDQERARRVQLGLDPRAVGSANITIAGDDDLTENVADSQATIAQRKKFGEATGASRAKLIDKGFENINQVNANIRNIDRAVSAIDEGASTGAIESRFFPTFRQATIKLEQVQKELGLDVIGAVTFGALSKGELDLALATALPTGLQPEELKEFLIGKKAAQEKLRTYYSDQIDFLDQGGSIAGFVRQMERSQQDAAPQPTGRTATNPQTGQQIQQLDNGEWVPIG